VSVKVFWASSGDCPGARETQLVSDWDKRFKLKATNILTSTVVRPWFQAADTAAAGRMAAPGANPFNPMGNDEEAAAEAAAEAAVWRVDGGGRRWVQVGATQQLQT